MADISWLAQLTTADKINIFNALGAWVSGIGTVLAVIVALYLARLDRVVKIRVSAGHRSVGQGPDISKYDDTCVVRVVNMGSRRVTITGVGWRYGFLKKRVMEQIVGLPPYPSPLPVTLADGEEATWIIRFRMPGEERDWLKEFSSTLGGKPRIAVKSLKVFVYTSVGKPVLGIVEKPLKELMVKAAEDARRNT